MSLTTITKKRERERERESKRGGKKREKKRRERVLHTVSQEERNHMLLQCIRKGEVQMLLLWKEQCSKRERRNEIFGIGIFVTY